MSKLIHYSSPAGSILLPQGYTRLAYIESTGTLWIDTGWNPSNNTQVQILIRFLSIINNHFFGSRAIATAGGGYAIGVINNKLVSDFNGSRVNFYTPRANELINILKKGVNTKINGTSLDNTNSTFSVSYSLYLLALNESGKKFITQLYALLYNCRIWEGDIIKRDFVPVQTTAAVTSADGTSCPSGSIGLLDLVENKFYLNKGTGTFISGPECPQGFPTSEYCLVETHSAVTLTSDVIPCYRRSDGKPGKYTLSTNTFTEVNGTIGPSITFGWGEVVNGGCITGRNLLEGKTNQAGKRCDEETLIPINASGYNDNATWSKILKVGKGSIFTLSFDAKADATNDAICYFYDNNSKLVQATREKVDGGAWTNARSDGFHRFSITTSWVRHTITWKFTDTGEDAYKNLIVCRSVLNSTNAGKNIYVRNIKLQYGEVYPGSFTPLHAIPHNISTGDGKNGEKNGAFDRGHIKTQGLESLKTSNWTIACWLYPLATSPMGGSAFLGLGSTVNGALVVESSRYFSYNTRGTARIGNLSLENNKWTHIAFVNNGNTIKYYKNGIYVNKIDSTNIVDTGELWVGSRCFGGEVNCRFLDIQVWDEIKNPAELM